MFSANRWEAAEQITTKLKAGVTLIIDRYSFSGAVYSAAKNNQSLKLDWAWNMEIGLPQPDLVLFLTIDPKIQADRGGFGAERYENDRMQMAVRRCFEELWKRYNGNVQNVDADGSLDEVEARIAKIVKVTLANAELPPLTLGSLSSE